MSVAITGVGLTPFGRHRDRSLKSLAGEAIDAALADARCAIQDIDMAFVANAMSAVMTGQCSVVGQSVLRSYGFAAIPVFNIDNACAGSSSALSLAEQAVRAGAARSVLVVGVEKLYSDDRSKTFRALNGAADLDDLDLEGLDPERESVFIKKAYAPRLEAYARRHGLEPTTLARIVCKNREHAVDNPVAQYRTPVTVEDVLTARMIVEPITALMCAPIGDGASAAVVTNADVAKREDRRPIWIRATAVGMASETTESPVPRVAGRAFQEARVGPRDVDVAEVHDSTAFTELVAYEHLGFCDPGQGARLVAEGVTTIGGALPINPSGGLESRGHPIAATGLAQIGELVHQLRGDAGPRQVPGASVALAENAGGFVAGNTAAVAVTILAVDP
jgi:acetyl-CoA acyltransferase